MFYLDVAYVLHICCKCMFQMFHLFHTYVAFMNFILHVFHVIRRVMGSDGGTAQARGMGPEDGACGAPVSYRRGALGAGGRGATG